LGRPSVTQATTVPSGAIVASTNVILKVIFESGTGHAVDLKPSRVYP
jgi:hypothetical protein